MKRRQAFTLVELLVAIGIIGLLVAILFPAVNAARSSARSTKCKNNLRQIAFSAINYDSARGYFPPARIQPHPDDQLDQDCGGEGISWVIHLLPYMEEVSFGSKWNVYGDFAGHDADLREKPLDILLCPERRTTRDAVLAFGNAPANSNNGGIRSVEIDDRGNRKIKDAAWCG